VNAAAETVNDLKVLQVAGSLFFRHGYEGTLISQISKEAGVRPPTIYWYYKSKAGLLASFLETLVQDVLNETSPTVEATSPIDRLRHFVHGHVVSILRSYGEYDAYGAQHGFNELVACLEPERQAGILEKVTAYIAAFRAILIEGEADGSMAFDDITVTSRAILTMTDNCFTWFRPGGRLEIDEVATQYADIAARIVAVSND